MSDQKRGLYRKYEVKRLDGDRKSRNNHFGCEYFVLDLTNDPHAIPALKAYVTSLEEMKVYPKLAEDLRAIIKKQQTSA